MTTKTIQLTQEELNFIFSNHVGTPVMVDLGLPINNNDQYEFDLDYFDDEDDEEWPDEEAETLQRDFSADYSSLHSASFMNVGNKE